MSARERCWLSLLKTGHVNAEQVKKCNELMMMMCWNKKICVDGLKEEVFKNGSLIMTMVSGEAPSSATSSSHRHGKQPVIPGEASSSSATTSSRRHGMQPLHEITEIEDVPDVEIQAEPEMDFEPKWNHLNKLEERLCNIDSPLYGPRPTSTIKYGIWKRIFCFKC